MKLHRAISLSLAGLAAAAALAPAAPAYPMGESRADLPFIRPAVSVPSSPLGEEKMPFYKPEPVATVTEAPSGSGFDWIDAAIGAAGGIGLTLAAVGGANLGRRTRAPRPAH